MAIVVDVNALSRVFNTENHEHKDFKPVLDWLDSGDGLIVIGGTRYKHELANMPRYQKLIRDLKDAGRIISVDDAAVDTIEKDVINKTQGTDCDDQHIIAILSAARCDVVCSADSRSYSFIKDRALYPKHSKRVRIYSGLQNSDLLVKCDIGSLSNVV